MHTVNLISLAIQNNSDKPELPELPKIGVCCVTGETCLTVPRKMLFGKSFTNIDLLFSPGSDRVGIDAYIALKYNWERRSSWICDENNFLRLNRTEARSIVFSYNLPKIWAGYITTSYKKHGSLKTFINTGNKRIWLFETCLVDCTDMERVNKWWSVLNMALSDGFNRKILETLNCPPYVMKKSGVKKWIIFEKWALQKYRSSLYSFLCYFLPSQKELENEKNA